VVGDVGLQQVLQRHVGRVLRRDHHGVQPNRPVTVVGDGDLSLAVRAQVGHLAGLADLGETLGQPVRQPDRQRQQLGRVVVGVAEHQALVARPLQVERVRAGLHPSLVGRVDALGDVRRLRADRYLDSAGVAVEPLGRAVVPDVEDCLADDRRDVHVRLGRHLAGDVHQPGGHHGLHRDPAARVLAEQGVEDGVTDLVTDLVGVPLGDGLGCE